MHGKASKQATPFLLTPIIGRKENMIGSKFRILGKLLRQPFCNPEGEQKRMMGRFCHTLSATSSIGFVTGFYMLLFKGNVDFSVLDLLFLGMGSMLLFLTGILIVKEK